jgi:hypothetical protein
MRLEESSTTTRTKSSWKSLRRKGMTTNIKLSDVRLTFTSTKKSSQFKTKGGKDIKTHINHLPDFKPSKKKGFESHASIFPPYLLILPYPTLSYPILPFPAPYLTSPHIQLSYSTQPHSDLLYLLPHTPSHPILYPSFKRKSSFPFPHII